MKSVSKLIVLCVFMFLGACVATPKYEISVLDEEFPKALKTNPSMAVAKFDAFTPSKAVDTGGSFFGVLGVLAADAATADDVEVVGITLQDETMKMLKAEFSRANVTYMPVDLWAGTNKGEVSKRFKHNRLWSISSLSEEEVAAYFKKHPKMDYGLHVKSYVGGQSPKITVDTDWIIYAKNGATVAKVNTTSVGELSKDNTSEKAYMKKVKTMQRKNIREFIRLINLG